MADQGMSWCPHCKCWVPENQMNYDYDDDGHLVRVCSWCLDGVEPPKRFVRDEHHEQVRCTYCGSYHTTEQAPRWNWFKCESCGKEFRRF